MNKPILFFDMDNVLVKFKSGIDKLDEATKQEYGEYYDSDGVKHEAHYDDVPGIFALMEPMDDAIDAVKKLAKKYDVYILSTAPWKNPTACNDKLAWVKKHFGGEKDDVFYKRLILTHHKNLCHGDYLIDDRPDKCGVDKFTGEVIHFGSERFPNWVAVVEYLMAK
jgi:5'(3')-deoxyribonucleotidase